MLNYNEYTSCLDTRLYKSSREIGVTSHRRRDSQCGDDKVSPLLLLIPNSAPQTFRASLPRIPHVTFIFTNSVSFFSLENRTCRTFGDYLDVHFVAPETKRFEIYSLFSSGFIYSKCLCVIVSRTISLA